MELSGESQVMSKAVDDIHTCTSKPDERVEAGDSKSTERGNESSGGSITSGGEGDRGRVSR